MRLFAIDNDNTITAFPAAEQIPEGQEHFATRKGACQARRQLAGRPPGPGVEQLRWRRRVRRRPQAGQEVHGPQERRGPDLESYPEAGRPRRAGNGGGHGDGHHRAQGGQGRAEEDQGDQGRPGPRAARPRRAKAARRPSCWNCCAARTARRWPRSPRPPTGRTTAFGASSAAASPRKWGSRSRASSARMANGATCWHSSTSPSTPTFPPPATTVGGFFVRPANSA